MNLKMPDVVGPESKRQANDQAQVRIVILVLVSFLLGVAATTAWFRFALKPNAENSNSQVSNPEIPVSQTGGESAAMQNAAQSSNTIRAAQLFTPAVNAAAIAEVKEAIPNYSFVSESDGERILRQAALKQLTTTAQEMDAQVRQAEQELVQAENGQPAAAQQAAMKHMQQTQAEQTEKLQQIAAHVQIQIAALKQLKSGAQ
jgi:hypothetical protein